MSAGSIDLHRQCARMFMVGFPGLEIDRGLEDLIAAGVFGAILFKRNIGSATDVAALCREIKQRAKRPFILAVDQEGGRVARLRGPPFAPLPSMRDVGRSGDALLAKRVGRLLALELRAIGFDWDFAPVLDVDTNPANPVIGDRALHREAEEVARLGVELARGIESGGVASCAKHFPGHGDTTQDSHHDLPRLPHDLERLRRVELVPFRAYARAGLAAVMTAHVVFEAVDPALPATLSSNAMRVMLRRELGFEGVIVSDDLEMKAITDHWPVGEAAVLSALAGVDAFLVCHHSDVQRQAIEALVAAVESGRVPHALVLEANRRIDRLASRFALPWADRLADLGGSEHRALAQGLVALEQGKDPTEAPS